MLLLAQQTTSQPKLTDVISPVLRSLLEVALAAWPLLLLIGVAGLAKLGYRVYTLRRLSRSDIAEVDAMDGRTFEVFLSTLFHSLGYRVEVTRYRGDYGADLVVEKEGRKTAVQAKCWRKPVGVKAVQEAVAAKAIYGCDAALAVANREFTQQARRLARANTVELWDREVLVGKLLAVRGTDAGVTQPVPFDKGHVALCATCGRAVSAKVREYCLARRERFGGRVYCFEHQRGVQTARTR